MHLFNVCQKQVNFFTYIEESISYNCVYLIVAFVKNSMYRIEIETAQKIADSKKGVVVFKQKNRPGLYSESKREIPQQNTWHYDIDPHRHGYSLPGIGRR